MTRLPQGNQSVVRFIFLCIMVGFSTHRAEAAGPVVSKTAGAEAGIDRLTWLGSLEKKLKNGKRPPCIGPLGCTVDIPVDSPCRRPVKTAPEVVIDGVVPGNETDTWIVAYRLVCSACYEGATGYLALVHVSSKGRIQVKEKVSLRKRGAGDIAQPLELVSDDFDEDGRIEVVCRYRNAREKERKCTGLIDDSAFLLIGRAKGRIEVLFHEQMDSTPSGKGERYRTTLRFDDVSEDGFPDLVLTRTADNTTGTVPPMTQSVRYYDEKKGRWSDKSYEGVVVGSARQEVCDVPLPGKPYAVVAAIHPESEPNDDIASLSNALRAAGFKKVCVYRAEAFGGFPAAKLVTIVSSHTSRQEADAVKVAVRRAGFSPYVKTLFEKK